MSGVASLYTTNIVQLCILIKQTVKLKFYRFARMQWETDGGTQDSRNLVVKF